MYPMTNELLLLRPGDAESAQRIFDAYAERTGLTAQPVTGGVSYVLEGADHRIRIVEILTDIDSNWPRHVVLGQPYGDDHVGPAHDTDPQPHSIRPSNLQR